MGMNSIVQAAYRGWRTRKRVVWGVRDELDALVADLQRDLQVAQVLLGVGAPLAATANARWLVEGERKGRLHLPRFDDKVFGVAFSLPSPPPPAYAAAALNAQKPIETAPPGRFSSQSGWSEKSSLCGEERDARDPSQAEAAGVTASGSLKADPRTSQLLSVEAILATHSRDEIVLELQWARQALRDRRKVSEAFVFHLTCSCG